MPMSRGSNAGSSQTTPLRQVVPTTEQATPLDTAPAPSTQAGRSPAPTATGVPTARPVAAAAPAVSPPAMSVDFITGGNRRAAAPAPNRLSRAGLNERRRAL